MGAPLELKLIKQLAENVLISFEELIGIPHYEIIEIQNTGSQVRIWARYSGPRKCPHCGEESLRNEGKVQRWIRQVSWSARQVGCTSAGTSGAPGAATNSSMSAFPVCLKDSGHRSVSGQGVSGRIGTVSTAGA